MMGEKMPALFKYRLSAMLPMYAGMPIAMAVEGGFAALVIKRSYIDESYLYFAAALLFLATLSAVAGINFYLKHLPISISQTGISSYLLGKRAKTISWRDVRKIERTRGSELSYSSNVTAYRIMGINGAIRFDDRLKDLRSLLDLLNVYICEHRIPILSIDKRMDTRQSVLPTISDREQKKAIVRHGVRTEIEIL